MASLLSRAAAAAKRRSFALVMLLGACLTGCAAGPDFRAPAAPAGPAYIPDQPASTAGAEASGTEAQHFDSGATLGSEWWKAFGSTALDALVQRALDASPDVEQAQAKLREAQADMEARAGSTYPSLDAVASAGRQKIDTAAFGLANIPSPGPFNLFNASVDASYTFDLFGANRRAIERLRAQVDYQRYELEATRLTLAANVVTAAIRRAALQEQIAATRTLLSVQSRQIQIESARRQVGAISERSLRDQQLLLAQAQASLPTLAQRRLQTEHQLAVYVGESASEAKLPDIDFDALRLPLQLPLIVPSALARQRPDIRAAEAQLQAASAAVGVATANLYPQLTLTGSAGTERTDGAALADGINVWSVGAGLMQPIVRGGALRAHKRSAVAAYDAAAAVYRQTVLRALQQVADVLTALDQDARSLQADTEADDQARAAFAIAERQHDVGGVSLLALLDAERLQSSTRLQQVAALADRYSDTAALFQSLGGGWGLR